MVHFNNLFNNSIIKFAIIGTFASLINLFVMFICVEFFFEKGKIFEIISFIISTELSIVFSFYFNSKWTWNDRYFEGFLISVFKYHFVIGISILLRLCMFVILQFFDVYYIINSLVGIILGAIINFNLNDKYVFKTQL